MIKATEITQITYEGKTGFYKRDTINNRSEGLGLPANEVEVIAIWKVKYKTCFQTIYFKIKQLFK